jgi:HEPN domain-containing protein
MREPADDLAREWFDSAASDLRVAEFLLTMEDPSPQAVGFHAQQCAEKALKAFLTGWRAQFERRHDLSYLIDLCQAHDSGFEQFRAGADELTPYAVEFRYPETPAAVTLDSVKSAVILARQIYQFALSRAAEA